MFVEMTRGIQAKKFIFIKESVKKTEVGSGQKREKIHSDSTANIELFPISCVIFLFTFIS